MCKSKLQENLGYGIKRGSVQNAISKYAKKANLKQYEIDYQN